MGRPNRAIIRAEMTSITDLLLARRLSYFLSGERIAVRLPEISPSERSAVERRLDRLQSACGCFAAAPALLVGVGIGWWSHASIVAICAYGIGAAIAVKVTTIAVSYFIYRGYVTMLCRRMLVERTRAVAQQ